MRRRNRPPSAGSRVAWRLVPLLVALLWPWPGLGERFASIFATVGNAAVGLDYGGHARIRFDAAPTDPLHPWWVFLSVQNVFTSESFRVPVDTRTVAYIRIAVFVSLALTWPLWSTTRGRRALAFGVGLLFSVIGLTLLVPLLQILGMVHVLGLGVITQSILSIGILSLITYPSMAFAIPALIWVLTAWLARAEPDAPAGSVTPGSGRPRSSPPTLDDTGTPDVSRSEGRP